jgi:hypothetical protein
MFDMKKERWKKRRDEQERTRKGGNEKGGKKTPSNCLLSKIGLSRGIHYI